MLAIILILVIILLLLPSSKIKYSSCRPTDNQHIKRLFQENKFKYTTKNNWDVYLPCKSELPNRVPVGGAIGYLEEPWVIGDRSNIWTALVNYGGRDYAKQVMPTTYRLPIDKELLHQEYKPQIYFLKSYKQRQEGLKITANLEELLNGRQEGYIQAQINVTNALTYQGYKLNFRVYLVVICRYRGSISKEYYLYPDGIVSYAKTKYTDGGFDSIVASFYTAKKHYQNGFPILISDFEKLVAPNRSNQIWNEMIKRTKMLTYALNNNICKKQVLPSRTHFQLFGLDYMFDDQYRGYLLEANAGPGMEPLNSKDGEMRYQVYRGIYQLLNLVKGNSKFIKINL